MMGQRVVEKPSRVSTALSGEEGVVSKESAEGEEGGYGNGAVVGWVVVLGDVPRERAAITS